MRILFVLMGMVMAVPAAYARDQILTLSSENDLYTDSGDAYYTNGLRASWLDADFEPPFFARWLANRLPFIDGDNPMVVQYSIGQNLYTPRDISIAAAQPNERPYAGYLYGSVGLSEGDRNAVNDMEISLGWVGPSALGEPTQKLVHRLVDAPTPRGWDNQLDDEPALTVSLQRRWPTWWERSMGTTHLSLMPHVGATVGNVYTHGAAGATLRWSSSPDLVVDNPVRVRPSPPGTGYFESDNEINWLVFAGTEGRAVARNIFLDGNTFSDSPSVDKKHLVADLQAGVVLTYDRYQLGYTAVYRTQEFYGQKNGQVFGAVNMAVKF